MMHPISLSGAPANSRTLWIMAVAWLIIALKCWWVWWAVDHWQLPFNALWVILPTVVAAGMATLLWLTHRD